ncbi:MAG: dihydropyrimidinase [Pseudomonadota bacterium]
MNAPFDLIVQGGTLVTPGGVMSGDIGIRGGRIDAVGRSLGAAHSLLDATGRVVTPGGVDPHAHIEQRSGMGLWNADTWESATHAAAMGGTTSVIAFAAQTRGQRLADAVADYEKRAGRGARIDYAFHLMLTDPGAPDFEDDLQRLIAEGHRTLKVFTTYDIRLDDTDILRILDLAREAGALTCVHAETHALIARATAELVARGMTKPRHHAASHPRLAEIEAVARVVRFAEATGAPVMIFHVSTIEAADLIRSARRRGLPVAAETCPHYLLMTEEVLDRSDAAKWMCSPPQRSEADRAGLWAALDRGDIALISSDHAPYRMDESGKFAHGADAPFPKIANGMPGLETRLPLMFDAMGHGARGGLAGFVDRVAAAPARLHGLTNKGRIAPGADADLVLWDPDRLTTYGDDDLHCNTGYNPWAGTRIRGWPETVLCRGEIIVSQGACHAAPGSGRRIDRTSWRPAP